MTTPHPSHPTQPLADAPTETAAATAPDAASGPDIEAVRAARAYLLRVAEPPAPNLVAFVAAHGPLDAAERVRAGAVPRSVRDEVDARRHLRSVEQDFAAAAARGARLVIPEDDEWPAWPLAALDVAHGRGVPWAGPPLALWVRGRGPLAALAERAVAVIGARAATHYGEHVATEFGHDLAVAGITVVSGAAYGIDAAAHRGALSAAGPTAAVLGCGVDVPYPAGHSSLLDRIADAGAVISEYPPGTPPARHRFLVRNRLIAALADSTVVVEAGRRSGSRNTAATAHAIGRMVLAVPGPITSAMSVGCHELLRAGDAHLVGSVTDLIESTGRLGDDLAPVEPGEVRETDTLDGRSLRVHDALSLYEPMSPEQVAVAAGVLPDTVQLVLPMLELAGLAYHGDSGWLRASRRGNRGDA